MQNEEVRKEGGEVKKKKGGEEKGGKEAVDPDRVIEGEGGVVETAIGEAEGGKEFLRFGRKDEEEIPGDH